MNKHYPEKTTIVIMAYLFDQVSVAGFSMDKVHLWAGEPQLEVGHLYVPLKIPRSV